jgi:hypothetical protein
MQATTPADPKLDDDHTCGKCCYTFSGVPAIHEAGFADAEYSPCF